MYRKYFDLQKFLARKQHVREDIPLGRYFDSDLPTAMVDSSQHDLFLRLLTKYERQLRRYVHTLVPARGDVDDILQDTTVLLWKKFDQYDVDRSFLTWGCKFAYFEVLKYRQRQHRQRLVFSDELVELLSVERTAHEALLEAQEEVLRGCMGQLPQGDRELVELRYATEMTVAQLAEEISEPVSRLYRELARIRRVLTTCVNRKMALDGWDS